MLQANSKLGALLGGGGEAQPRVRPLHRIIDPRQTSPNRSSTTLPEDGLQRILADSPLLCRLSELSTPGTPRSSGFRSLNPSFLPSGLGWARRKSIHVFQGSILAARHLASLQAPFDLS